MIATSRPEHSSHVGTAPLPDKEPWPTSRSKGISIPGNLASSGAFFNLLILRGAGKETKRQNAELIANTCYSFSISCK
jgi:hypothetical protein